VVAVAGALQVILAQMPTQAAVTAAVHQVLTVQMAALAVVDKVVHK